MTTGTRTTGRSSESDLVQPVEDRVDRLRPPGVEHQVVTHAGEEQRGAAVPGLRAATVAAIRSPPSTGETRTPALAGYRASTRATTNPAAPCPTRTAWRGRDAATWTTSWTYARSPVFGAAALLPWPRRLIAYAG